MASIGIVFDAEFTANDFKVFDLPPAVMETVRAGDSVCFKGRGDGEVVLCSGSATYAVRKVESSNTTLVLPSTNSAAFCEPRVVGSINCTYEVEPTTPFLTDLRDMLEERPYTESDADDAVSGSTGQLYTMAGLVAGTRASEGEIATALHTLGAAEIGGHIRIVEKALLAYTFDLVLSLAEEKGWDLGAVSIDACCSELGDSPPFAIAQAVALHGDPAPAGQTDCWAFDALKVATFVALQLLQEPPSGLDRWLTSKFVAAWRDKRPEAFQTMAGGDEMSLDILGGVVVEEGCGTVTGTIRLFPIPRLSIDPETRFVQLFGIKSRWSESELRPFLKDLNGAPKLLLKFTRSLMEDGVRYHCAR